MNHTTRTIFIALGVSLLVLVLVPLLFMAGMLGGMTGGMGGMMNGGWVMGPLILLILVIGIVLIVIGTKPRR